MKKLDNAVTVGSKFAWKAFITLAEITAVIIFIVILVGVLSSSGNASIQPVYTQDSVKFYGTTVRILQDNKRHVICYDTSNSNSIPMSCVADPAFMKPKASK